MEKAKEKCPQCGKKLKFLKKHIKRYHSLPGEVPIIEKKDLEISKEKIPGFLKDINLKEEFDKMTETINPKKSEESKEPKYKCGSCGGSFGERHKRCPHCGVEFE